MKKTDIIWDVQTRLTHWSLATAIILNLFVLEEGDDPHNYVGYAAVAFVCVRALWGFIGGEQSRFRSFPIQPKKVLDFVKSTLKGTAKDHPGHNPAASVAYLSTWTCVIALGITGWMMGLDAFWGEEWLEETHEAISNGLQVLIVVHLIGIAMDSKKHKRRTWLGMIRGNRD